VAAARFHATLVAWGLAATEGFAGPVVLAGGCFQNPVLVDGLVTALQRRGQRVLLPRRVPPGDGGIPLGQAWVARRR
jgi:hydrogenase maturation protein HypF